MNQRREKNQANQRHGLEKYYHYHSMFFSLFLGNKKYLWIKALSAKISTLLENHISSEWKRFKNTLQKMCAFGSMHYFFQTAFTFSIFFPDNDVLLFHSCQQNPPGPIRGAAVVVIEVVKKSREHWGELSVMSSSSGWGCRLNTKLVHTSWKSLVGAAIALVSSRYCVHVHCSVLLSPASQEIPNITFIYAACKTARHYQNTNWDQKNTGRGI